MAADISKTFGVDCRAFKCEVSHSDSVNQAVKAVQEAYGREVDIGIANAGICNWKDAHENTDGEPIYLMLC